MNLKLFIILSSALLVGCGAVEKLKRDIPPQIITEWKTYDCGTPPARDPINFKVPVFVVTSEGLYTLTPEQYAKLGENMQDIIKASGQLIEVIRFYQSCIDAAQEKDDGTNSQTP